MTGDLADAERDLRYARTILATVRPSDGSEDWLLLATLIGEADLTFQEARRRDPSLAFPLLESVVQEYYEVTAGFTDPEFLRRTRAERRQNPRLFRVG